MPLLRCHVKVASHQLPGLPPDVLFQEIQTVLITAGSLFNAMFKGSHKGDKLQWVTIKYDYVSLWQGS